MNAYMMENINLKEFVVVKKDLFARERIPILSINQDHFTVNTDCHDLLNNCESVQFMVNIKEKEIVLKPISSSDESAVVWRNDKLVKKKLAKLICPQLGTQLFRAWNLNAEYQYRMKGVLAKADNKVVLLFRMNGADVFSGCYKEGVYEQ